MVKVRYDENIISLEKLLVLFFRTIDPTSLNKQGNDVGTRYRVGIYYTDEKDRSIIIEKLSDLQKSYSSPIVIENEPLKNFYGGEEYHQNYLDKNPNGYCHIDLALFEFAKNAN